ncbi:hypothetical protein D3C79_580070 [compost metagenome]
MADDGIARNAQAQAKTTVPWTRTIQPGKRRKDALKVGLGNTAALVLQPQQPVIALAAPAQADHACAWRVPNGIAQNVLQRLGQAIEVALHPAGSVQVALQLRRRPGAFKAGILGEHFPQGLNLDRLLA